MCSMNSHQNRTDSQFDKTEDRSLSQSRNTTTSQVVKSLVTSRHTDSNTRRSDNKNVNQSRDKSPKKAKKNKHKSRKKSKKRSSDTDSSDTDDSTKLLLRLQKERIQQAIERKRQKELMKLKETPEEKRTRRLREKLEKERKRKERMGWDNEYQHYTNTDNPFGDGNLTSTFVWSKKLDKEGLRGLTHADLELRNRHKQFENKIELEKVKKRRQERELERQQREDEVSMLQRSKEAAQFQEWERQEDAFHLEQARLRSCIRIQDGRAKPIDLLAKYIGAEDEVDAVEMHEPYTYLNGLGAQDFEDLVEDIKVYKELERGHNLDYWNDLTVIVEDELHKLRKIEGQSEYQAAVGRREGIHQSVVKDVTEIFKGKTANELLELQKQIERKISGKNDGVDVGYWESLLSQLKAHMARARLRDRHQENLRKKLQLLQAEQNVTGKRESEHESDSSSSKSCSGLATSKDADVTETDAGPSSSHTNVVDTALGTTLDTDANKKESDDDSQDSSASETEESPAEALLSECFRAYDSGGYSPTYLAPSQLEPGTVIVDEETDNNRLAFSRAAKVSSQDNNKDRGMVGLSKAEQALRLEARKGMGGDEAEFSVETGLEAQVYLWSDKYRPRKPRYFNRVHTGFEWNKYNQTHYDMDNPPPKIVQGYKFNIFYPDLIDKNNTPEYFLTPCPDNRDFALLRFRAGPPYEDIAFKIVSREWEYSYKRGFRCQFHNNVFQLWFHFKRYRYRR